MDEYSIGVQISEQIGQPFEGKKLQLLTEFLQRQDLTYDEKIQYTYNLLDENDLIIGTGSIDNTVLKCIAIDERYQGQGLLAKIITNLTTMAYSQGKNHLFLYTKPHNYKMFSDFGFFEIAKTQSVLLMENKKYGIENYIGNIVEQTNKKFPEIKSFQDISVGAMIVNCNPFTLGHKYLVEEASKKCELLHIFVVSNDVSMFPQKVRYALVQEGTKDIKNVIIHETQDYLISPATFPTYFIKDKLKSQEINCRLDIEVFVRHIVSNLGISKRFVGTEPNCQVTRFYNEQLKKYLSEAGVELIEIERKESDGIAISASLVRKCMQEQHFQKLKNLVPACTYDYIIHK